MERRKRVLVTTRTDASLVEVKLLLGDFIRRQRTRKKLTQRYVAKVLRSGQSRVSKIEAGDPKVSLDLVMRAAFAVGASREEVAKALARR